MRNQEIEKNEDEPITCPFCKNKTGCLKFADGEIICGNPGCKAYPKIKSGNTLEMNSEITESNLSCELTLSSGAYDMFREIIESIPYSCPLCLFQHPSETFNRNKDASLACASCGYVLRESDFWHSDILD